MHTNFVKVILISLIIIVAPILWLGCGNLDVAGRGSTTETTNGITARVLLPNGSPAVGALLRVMPTYMEACGEAGLPECAAELQTWTVKSDAQGLVRVRGLASGQWRANVDWQNLGVSRMFSMDSGNIEVEDLVLDSLGVVEGWVPSIDYPVLVRLSGTNRWTHTDAQGNFRLEGAYAGSWLVSAQFNDGVSYAGQVRVPPGGRGRVHTWYPRTQLPPTAGPLSGLRWDFVPQSGVLWTSPQPVSIAMARADFIERGGVEVERDMVLLDGSGRLLPWAMEREIRDTMFIWTMLLPVPGAPGASVWAGVGLNIAINNGSPLDNWLEFPWVMAHNAPEDLSLVGNAARILQSPEIEMENLGKVGSALAWEGDSCNLAYELINTPLQNHWSQGGSLGWWMRLDSLYEGRILFAWYDAADRVIWQVVLREEFNIGLEWESGSGRNDMERVQSNHKVTAGEFFQLTVQWDSGGRRVLLGGRPILHAPPLPVDEHGTRREILCLAGKVQTSIEVRAGRTVVDQVMLALPDPLRVSWPLLMDLWNQPMERSTEF